MTARTTVRPLQLVLSVAVIAVALLAVGVYLFGWGRNVPTPASLVTIGGPFTLTTHAGEKLSDADGGDYTIDHTASIYLMDSAGEFTGTISYGETMEERLDKLRRLISAGAA